MTAFENEQARFDSLGRATYQILPLKGFDDIEFGMTRDQVRVMLASLDPSTVDDEDGATAFDLAIGIRSEDDDDLGPDAPLTTFLIGRAGY